jgi:hypothetical protein
MPALVSILICRCFRGCGVDSISMADKMHRDYMEKASAQLLRAILDARAGTCPATPLNPAGLPRDYSNASGPKDDTRPRWGVDSGGLDQVEALMQRGKKAGEIAQAMGINVQKAVWMMKGVRNRRKPVSSILWG